MSQKRQESAKSKNKYTKFDQLDGHHLWQKKVPEGCVKYKARKLNSGVVTYFNFNLAKEMGLISKSHVNKMNTTLEKKLLDTFSLRIINEYDTENNIEYNSKNILKNEYMATRYLQLQHPNKKGETSGDGRCIWNGTVTNSQEIWDVSSRGTGVTCLAPGVVLAGKPLESGNTDFGYGCGLAEIDELYSSTIMAEILFNHNYNTERMLAIIDFGDGTGIGVRAGKNLFRPAHLFSFLKQNKLDCLEKATQFIIERNYKNKTWNFSSKHPKKWDLLLEKVCEDFAEFAAKLERDYIFAWMDWDGDNVLMNAGIIDYGSIRQFGLRHDQYRYDDVERFSTNLNEQRQKIRLIVQVFAQLTEFIKTKNRKPLVEFKDHKILKRFDKHYKKTLLMRFMQQVGLSHQQSKTVLAKNKTLTKKLYDSFYALEAVKTKLKLAPVDDGVNKPAIFNVRHMLIQMPTYYKKNNFAEIPDEEFFNLMLADSAHDKDQVLTANIKRKINNLQKTYRTFLLKVFGESFVKYKLDTIIKQASDFNRPNRVTGNGLVYVVDELLEQIRNGLKKSEIQNTIDLFIQSQTPSKRAIVDENSPATKKSKEILVTFENLVEESKESI